MATDRPTPPEGVDMFDNSGGTDGDVPTIDLDPGAVVDGIVLDILTDTNSNGRWWRLKIKDENHDPTVFNLFAKDDVKGAMREEKIEQGTRVWIARDTVEEEFTNDDGEDRSYYPTMIGFPEGPA